MKENKYKKLLGDGPYPFPLADMEKRFGIYSNPSIIILDLNSGVDFFPAQHMHSSYEFTVLLSSLKTVQMEKRCFQVQMGDILPINSEQGHGAAGYYKNCSLFTWQIDKNAIEQIAASVYGRREVSFSNDFVSFTPEIKSCLSAFMGEYKSKQAGYKFILDGLLTQLIVTMLRHIKSNVSNLDPKRILSARPNIQRAIEYLQENFQDDFSLNEVAEVANLSPYHFIRIFKKQTGKTPYEYLLDIKIERAREMLKSRKELNITQVCFLCGFNNPSHFSSVFKKKTKVSPSKYRKLSL